MYSDNNWVIIKNSSQKGKVIETTELWGMPILTVWVPVSDAIVRLSPAEVEPTSQSRFFGDENMLRYLTFLERKQLTWFPRYEKSARILRYDRFYSGWADLSFRAFGPSACAVAAQQLGLKFKSASSKHNKKAHLSACFLLIRAGRI